MDYTAAEIEKMRAIVKKYDDDKNKILSKQLVEFWNVINECAEDDTLRNGVHYLKEKSKIPGLTDRNQISIPLSLVYNIYATVLRMKGIKPLKIQDLEEGFKLSRIYIGLAKGVRIGGRTYACHQFLTDPNT
jgi:hypothetical protein